MIYDYEIRVLPNRILHWKDCDKAKETKKSRSPINLVFTFSPCVNLIIYMTYSSICILMCAILLTVSLKRPPLQVGNEKEVRLV